MEKSEIFFGIGNENWRNRKHILYTLRHNATIFCVATVVVLLKLLVYDGETI